MRNHIIQGTLPCWLGMAALLTLAACGDKAAPGVDAAPTLESAARMAFSGDAVSARRAFARLAKAAPDDATPRIWIAVLGGGGEGLAAFTEGEGFDAALARWAAGARERDVLMMAAGSVEDDAARAAARTRARFYLGLAAEQAGDKEAARKNYEAAVTRAGEGVAELGWAKERLAALGGS